MALPGAAVEGETRMHADPQTGLTEPVAVLSNATTSGIDVGILASDARYVGSSGG